MGEIRIQEADGIYVRVNGKGNCVIFGCEDTPEVREAGVGLIEAYHESGMQGFILVVDQVNACVHFIDKIKLSLS